MKKVFTLARVIRNLTSLVGEQYSHIARQIFRKEFSWGVGKKRKTSDQKMK
jgi:hypothetical protein